MRRRRFKRAPKDPDYRGIENDIKPVDEYEPEVKVVLYGRAGTGKTTLASTFPKPVLIIDLKEKGTDSVRTTSGVDVIRVTGGWQQLEKVYWYLKKGAGKKYKTVVIDTVSGVQDLSIQKVLEDSGKEPAEGKLGGWGTMQRREWGTVASDLKSFIFDYKELPMNVVFIAHDRVNSEEVEDEDAALTPQVGPRVMPSIASTLNASVGTIGNTFIRENTRRIKIGKKSKEKRVVEYCLRIGPHSLYVTKVRKPKAVIAPAFIIDPTYEKILSLIEGE